MSDRIALKRLTASDLTFFEHLFHVLNAGNQKAINLNADVFIDELYPGLPALTATVGDVIPVTMTILGPAAAPAHVLSRAVTKREAYKNWRLNGEFVRDPDGQAGRFNGLSPGDLAVMEFSGDPAPKQLTLLLIAAGAPDDAPLHEALNGLIPGGRKTMIQVTREQIASAAAQVPETHPIWSVAADPEFDAALEDAAQGGVKGTETLESKVAKTAKTVTAAALAAAKASAEKNGREGEALAWIHLQKMKDAGTLSEIEWSSKTNAVSPYDFKAVQPDSTVIRIDAKSTSGSFGNIVHVSVAELKEAAGNGRYDLWRVYELNEEGAKLRIAESIGVLAKSILEGFALPHGVTVDSISIEPASLAWGQEFIIERPEDAPDGE
jgi:hypothetical protein